MSCLDLTFEGLRLTLSVLSPKLCVSFWFNVLSSKHEKNAWNTITNKQNKKITRTRLKTRRKRRKNQLCTSLKIHSPKEESPSEGMALIIACFSGHLNRTSTFLFFKQNYLFFSETFARNPVLQQFTCQLKI